MTAVHDQSLLLRHLTQVMHHQPVLHPAHTQIINIHNIHNKHILAKLTRKKHKYLGPVTKHLPVASVGDKLLRKLKNAEKNPTKTNETQDFTKTFIMFSFAKLIQAMDEAHLSNSWVQVVHDHQHYRGSLTCAAWVLIYGVRSGERGQNG